ncbi:MAG: NAD(P)H-hydrate dehydratase [Planctomycetaceae bacterium]
MTNASSLRPPLLLPRRQRDSHKGDYGRVLLVGGSRGMAGSISLSALAAMRAGAGLVSVFVPDRCLETVAGFDACLMTVAAPDNAAGQFDASAISLLETHAAKASVIGIGPGMGTGAGSVALVTLACGLSTVPRVFDADALNVLAQSSDEYQIDGPAVLTPHPGEMQRLTGTVASDREGQIEAAVKLAAAQDVVVLLKGAPTFVTDGHERWFNPNGNPGMAKGGSGDCLTGIISSLLGQGLPPCPAAKLGAYVHGLAGDLAAKEVGEAGMMPTDLIRHLPAAIKAVTQ